MPITLFDVLILGACATGALLGVTLILAGACDAACDWIDRRERL